MITVFLGDDTKRSHDALFRAVDDKKGKDPNVLVSRFNDVSFDPVLLREAFRNQSIFGRSNIVVVDGILEHKEGEEFYRTFHGWDDTVNFIFIREQVLPKEVRVLLEKIGVVKEFTLKKADGKNNNFALADAVAMRNKRSAWLEFIKQRRSGGVVEEMHGIIFWALKTLYLCATQTKDEVMKTGVKEFTYRTYQPRVKNFSVREIEEKLGELKDMYHLAHQGDGDLFVFLEQFLLKL